MSVATVVEEDASTGDAMVCPMVDGAFLVGVGAKDVFAMGVIVESLAGDMGKL